MKKVFAKAAAVVLALALAGCSSSTPEKENENGSAGADSVKEGTVYTETPAGFSGNTGEVSLNIGDTYAIIRVEKFGDIKIKLFPEAAPYGVQNFIDLADSGYFEGKNIHRVISGFMLQGGSLNGDGTGGEAAEGGEFYCEINSKMRHFYGALCYANAGGRNTCQFYIVNNKEPQKVDDSYYNDNADEYQKYADMLVEEGKKYDEGTYGNYYYSMMAETYKSNAAGFRYMAGKDENGTVQKKYEEVGGTPSLDGSYTVFGQTVKGFDVIDAISAAEVRENSQGELSSPVEEIIISSVTIYKE